VEANIAGHATNAVIHTSVASPSFAAESELSRINRPYTVDNSSRESAAVVVGTSKLIARKDAKLNEYEEHEKKRVQKRRNRTYKS
jgi:hypothetical protein